MHGQSAREFAAFEACFERAALAAGVLHTEQLAIGGKRVDLRFAGPALVPHLTAALQHQRVADSAPAELVISVWDSASTGVDLSTGIGDLERHQTRGMPSVPPEDGVYAAYLRPDPGLSMLDLAAGRGVYWLPDSDRVPFEDRSGPFRGILNWWMSHNGRQFIHAAAVGTEAGAVLVVGPSGSGKSTTALTCMLDGMLYLGDDYCLLEPSEQPVVHSLYLSAKLHQGHLERFPELRGAVVNDWRLRFEKGVLDLNLVSAVNVRRASPIHAVLVPRVTHQLHTEIVPTGRAAALAALAPSTMLQLASAREDAMRRMGAVVRSVPAFELRAGTNLPEIPVAIRRLLESLSAGAAK